MKKFTALLTAAALTVAMIGNAQADWDHHREYRRAPVYPEHHRSHDWIGPAAILAITGAVIGATAYRSYNPEPVYVRSAPQPVYVAPQPVYVAPPPPSGSWYYCSSAGQYYPYVQYCPEGWQAVPPR